MTLTPLAAATELIRFAAHPTKLPDDPPPVAGELEVAVELATDGLDTDQLRSVLKLVYEFTAELYRAKRLAAELLDRQDRLAFDELAAMLTDVDGCDPHVYDADPIGAIWRATPTDSTGGADQ